MKRRHVGFSLLAASLMGASAPALQAAEAGHAVVDDAWSTPIGFQFSGRLTEDKHVAPVASDGKAAALYRNAKLLFASAGEGEVSWKAGELSWSTRVDARGYWLLKGNHPLKLAAGWHALSSEPSASSPAHLWVHDPRNKVGIISDIDDTIMVSNVPSTTKLLKNSLMLPPESREAVPGMAALYAQLAQQNPAPSSSPLFYLSASPRQLSDSLRRFLAKQNFPKGVLMLKEVAKDSPDPLTDQQAYKLARIQQIMHSLPEVKFILIGDDGERDPETYAEVQKQFPQQVASIWIRRVHPDAKRARFEGQKDVAELLK